jgi:hypothetical protein
MKAFPKHLLTKTEKELFDTLSTPQKIQDYLITLPHNHRDSVKSVRRSIKSGRMHCFEGAMFAAAVLWYHGEEPLIFDLMTTNDDQDHVVALFKQDGFWGTISSTQHSILRFRDPVFKNMREIALSYFHEYFLNDGTKTLRSFSKKPFSLLPYGNRWLFDTDELYDIGTDLYDSTHEPIVPKPLLRRLRKADPVERKAASIKQI